VLILVEKHSNHYLENIEEYDWVFDAVGSTQVVVCMDNANFYRANVDLGEIFNREMLKKIELSRMVAGL
jgi:hypothetical protein